MTNRNPDVHCKRCRAYMYSRWADEGLRPSDAHALCSKCAKTESTASTTKSKSEPAK